MSRAEEAAELAAQLSVVSGTPNESELAALVAGIAAAVANGAGDVVSTASKNAAASVWANRAHQRGNMPPGPGSWRWSHR